MNEVVSKMEEYRYRYNGIVSPSDAFLKPVTMRYDLRGANAGQARHIRKTDEFIIRINMDCLGNYYDDYMATTLPHELAHLIVMDRWPNAAPHGERWASTMYLLDVLPDRCHQYSYTPARVVSKYPYTCLCTIHAVAKRTHLKMQRGLHRTCNSCHERLIFMNEVANESV